MWGNIFNKKKKNCQKILAKKKKNFFWNFFGKFWQKCPQTLTLRGLVLSEARCNHKKFLYSIWGWGPASNPTPQSPQLGSHEAIKAVLCTKNPSFLLYRPLEGPRSILIIRIEEENVVGRYIPHSLRAQKSLEAIFWKKFALLRDFKCGEWTQEREKI